MNKKSQEKPKSEIVQKQEETYQSSENEIEIGSPPPAARAGKTISIKEDFPVAPASNFQKVTNTITRNAIPQRLFRTGKTKEIYDVLYSLTRGAVTPQRFVIVSKPRLRKLTGVGSRITLDTCLGYLEIVGLIIITKNASGQHEGNHYEVFTPEELENSTGTSTGTSTPGSPAQTLGVVPRLVSRRGSTGSEAVNIRVSDTPKTSFKTNTNDDDEAFADLIKKLSAAVEKMTGKKPSAREREQWGVFADLLTLELETAASRTGEVSSVPAFLTEVLRRQFFAVRREQKQSPAKTFAAKPDTVGKSGSEAYEIKSLDEQGREAALEQLSEFAAENFLEDFKKWYTPGDWQWLTDKLKISKSENEN